MSGENTTVQPTTPITTGAKHPSGLIGPVLPIGQNSALAGNNPAPQIYQANIKDAGRIPTGTDAGIIVSAGTVASGTGPANRTAAEEVRAPSTGSEHTPGTKTGLATTQVVTGVNGGTGPGILNQGVSGRGNSDGFVAQSLNDLVPGGLAGGNNAFSASLGIRDNSVLGQFVAQGYYGPDGKFHTLDEHGSLAETFGVKNVLTGNAVAAITGDGSNDSGNSGQTHR